jgi:alpha-galactosidase
VKRIVEDYHLDMLEHDGYLVAQGCTKDDHPHAPPKPEHAARDSRLGSDFVLASNSTDVSYHAVRSYYDIYEQTRREHPGLLFEICNDGGRMVDFGSAAHGDYFSITDTYDPLSNRRAFYDASYVLPAGNAGELCGEMAHAQAGKLSLHAAQRNDGMDDDHARHDCVEP